MAYRPMQNGLYTTGQIFGLYRKRPKEPTKRPIIYRPFSDLKRSGCELLNHPAVQQNNMSNNTREQQTAEDGTTALKGTCRQTCRQATSGQSSNLLSLIQIINE